MSDVTELVDLAAERLGGMVLWATDEFFAPKERLLDPRPPVFDPDRYTDRGKEMDGWETRRRRGPGHDWCIVRLGVAGIVRGVVVDTSFFRGNYPERCSLEGTAVDDLTGEEALLDAEDWVELLPDAALEGDAENAFAVDASLRVTHLRFHIHPDGGVARLRVHGEPLPDLRSLVLRGGEADLVAVVNGGLALAASDRFFSSPHHLNAIGDARDMGDGWETRRRRGPGRDWAILRLAAPGLVERVEVDTTNFKGNFPDRCSLDVAEAPFDEANPEGSAWREALAETPLRPHARHVFDLQEPVPATHVRLNIRPDGGVARLRVFGQVTDEGWRAWGVRWLNAELPGRCEAALFTCCGSRAWAGRVASSRPFASFDALLGAADRAWDELAREDRLEAFAVHPRIGERSGVPPWSRQEQAGVSTADAETLRAIQEGNRAYEQRFGHVFLIDATGKGAEEILIALLERLRNEPEVEFAAASEQQRLIARRRLEKLMRP